MNDESVFTQLGSLIRVRHVQSRLGPTFSKDMLLDEAFEVLQGWMEDHNWLEAVCLVREDGEPVGFTDTFSMAPEIYGGVSESPDDVVGDIMVPLTFSSIISADLPLLEATELLLVRDRQALLVLDGKDITGAFVYGDAFKLPGVMCLFALMVELEAASLRLCHAFSDQCWYALSETRRSKAEEVWRKRVGHPPEFEALVERCKQHGGKALLDSFIECTTFIDKPKMIGKCKLLIDWGRDKLDSIFNRAEQVRNACAHPAENGRLESILPRDRFGGFLRDCRQLIESIRTVTPRETPNSSSSS